MPAPPRTRREATPELVRKRNSIERLKEERFPLDIIDDLPRLIAQGYEAVPEEDIVRLNWWGLTHDKPKLGTFMVRIKVPGGVLAPHQLRGIGHVAREFGKNYGEMTTRQGLQLHWVRLDQLPEVLAAVQRTGLTTVGGEGDTVRNITGCPVVGIAREELFDVRPVIDEAARFFYGNREYSNLPRKHKYTISACPAQCNGPEFHDVALIGARSGDRDGFAVRVGGGLSSTPRLSRDLGVFVPVGEAIEVLRAITDAWQSDLRYRVSRAKARIKFMVDDYGPEGVRELVEERLGRRLEDLPAPAPAADADHLGVHPQRQEGRSYAGFSVPMGWISGDQMIAIADLVESYGGDIRLTRQQDLILGNVPDERLDGVLAAMAANGYPIDRNKVYGNSIACTSHRFCNYSVAETKGKLEEILAELVERFGEAVSELGIFMDGCPHACAHHWVGEIGLQGTTTTRPGSSQRVEAYDVTLRGGLGRRAAIGRPVLRRVPTDELNGVLIKLIEAWLADKAARNGHGGDYAFRDFCDERTDEELAAIADGTLAAGAQVPQTIVRVPGTLIELSGGADEVEVGARTVGGVLDELAERHPELAAYLRAADGKLNTAVNLYVGEEDIRSLDGLDTALDPGDELTILPALAGG